MRTEPKKLLLASLATSMQAQAKYLDQRETLRNIITVTDRMSLFWRKCDGWAPKEAATLLKSARLDRQLSFAHTLPDYFEPFPVGQAEAKQILGYASLRSMCEGVLKLFFGVWLRDYNQNPLLDGRQQPIPVDKINFDRLIAHYSKVGDSEHEKFLRRVQQRGNGIHHFTDRDIGTQDELKADILNFRDFLLSVNARLPYPDDIYNPAY